MKGYETERRLPDVPASFTAAILQGGARIRRYERQKKRVRRLAAAAACATLLIGAAVLLLMRPGIPDASVTLAPPETALKDVWVHPEDAYYHLAEDCPRAREDAVKMQKDTAREFEKEACPECIGGED